MNTLHRPLSLIWPLPWKLGAHWRLRWPAAPARPALPSALPQVAALPPGQACTLQRSAGRRLLLVSGRLWLTVSGDPTDHVLQAGDSLPLPRRGPVVVENDGQTTATWLLC